MSGYGPCYVEDCEDWKFAKGLCQRHYMRQYRYGRLELAPPKEDLPCAVNAIEDGDGDFYDTATGERVPASRVTREGRDPDDLPFE